MTQDYPDNQTPPEGEPAANVETQASPPKRSWFGRSKKAEPPAPPNKGRGRPPLRSERSRSPFIVASNMVLTLLVLAMLGLATVVHYGLQAFDAPGPLQADTLVDIPRGSGARDVAERLGEVGAISSEMMFVVGIQATGNRGKLQAGEYQIAARSTMRDIMQMLIKGDVVEHSVTVAEGLTSLQIVNRLMEEPLLTGSVREVPPEGTLLPETYQVTRGMTREQLLARMTQAQQKLLNDVWARRNPNVPVKTPQELVTLASIVEKETGIASERPHVASVFSNRLLKRMRLQSDPTIIYGMVGGKGTLGRPILRSEIAKPTPYNTYTIPGLPPGPIANPGRASMEAVANPLDTSDLYFVADGSGGHAFAPSYAEHQKNVAKWRSIDKAGENDRAPAEAITADPEQPAPNAPRRPARRP